MDYKSIFNRFNDLNILIIGDVMVDSYKWGEVNRISPEAPVPICSVKKIENRLGGAANVALNIEAMGANPILCSVIGDDTDGEMFLDLLQQRKMSYQAIVKSILRPTTTKTRILGNNCQMLRIDKETTDSLKTEEEASLLSKISSTIENNRIDCIIFQDYDKGVITQNIIKSTVEQAKQRNIPICVDPKKRNFSLYKGVSMFKPNLKELKEGLKIDFDKPTIENLNDAALLLHQKQNIEKVFITLSQYGVFIADYTTYNKETNTTVSKLIPAHLRKISDVSGAGDTVISVAALCLSLNMDAENLAKISNLAGGLVCESVGVVPIDKEKLYKEVLTL